MDDMKRWRLVLGNDVEQEFDFNLFPEEKKSMICQVKFMINRKQIKGKSKRN